MNDTTKDMSNVDLATNGDSNLIKRVMNLNQRIVDIERKLNKSQEQKKKRKFGAVELGLAAAGISIIFIVWNNHFSGEQLGSAIDSNEGIGLIFKEIHSDTDSE